MIVPDENELLHLKIQAAMRENNFPHNQLMYLGVREGTHWYLIAGEHEVPVSMLEGFERIDDEE
jgi:hypothetical protein